MKQTVNITTPESPSQYRAYDDEIDLFELASKLWMCKSTILFITFFVTLVACVTAFLLPKTWESEVVIYPPTQANLAQLNKTWGLINIDETANPISIMEAYNSFFRYLSSPATLRKSFEISGYKDQHLTESTSSEEIQLANTVWKQFSNSLTIERSDSQKNSSIPSIRISFQSNDPIFTADLLNNYIVPEAQRATRKILLQNMEINRLQKLEKIDREIKFIETAFIENNKVREIRLLESLAVARAGLIKRSDNLNMSRTLGENSFLLGTDILTEQLKIVKNQGGKFRLLSQSVSDDNDKPMLPAVAKLYHQQRQKIENIDINKIVWSPISLDLPAQQPISPIKPKKMLIIALGIVLGGMLGIFVALIRVAITSRKKRLQYP